MSSAHCSSYAACICGILQKPAAELADWCRNWKRHHCHDDQAQHPGVVPAQTREAGGKIPKQHLQRINLLMQNGSLLETSLVIMVVCCYHFTPKISFFMSCRILTCITYLLHYLKKLFLLCQIFAIGSQQLSMIFDLKTFHWPEHMVCALFRDFQTAEFYRR